MLSNMYNSADKKSYKDEFEFRSSEEEDLLFAYREEMENLPEIISYIKSLNKEIHKHKSKIEKLHRKIKRLKTKLKERPSTADVGIQTEDLNSFNLEDGQTIEESVKETAEQAMKQTGFVYESTSGMYYDYNTGYYYNAELGLYYDGNSGTYLYYDENEKKYVYHSQVDLPESDAQKSTSNNLEAKRKLKESSSKEPKKKKVKKKETDWEDLDDDDEEDSEEEEGECSDTSEDNQEEEEDKNEQEEEPEPEPDKMETDETATDNNPLEASQAWPPCMRIIVTETNIDGLKIGNLFLVPYTGATIGREKENDIRIPDLNVSKVHARLTFNEENSTFEIVDLGSRNGTLLNGKRLSVTKCESDPNPVPHGSFLQFSTTRLLCHVHAGTSTCGHCEPGLVQKQGDKNSGTLSEKPGGYRRDLRQLKKRFGLDGGEPSVSIAPGYEDRAETRRKTIGSQNEHAKTEQASLEDSIRADNKGFKLLSKMGWSEGQPLGKNNEGRTEPVQLSMQQGTTGLGCPSVNPLPESTPSSERRKAAWRKAQQRYNKIT